MYVIWSFLSRLAIQARHVYHLETTIVVQVLFGLLLIKDEPATPSVPGRCYLPVIAPRSRHVSVSGQQHENIDFNFDKRRVCPWFYGLPKQYAIVRLSDPPRNFIVPRCLKTAKYNLLYISVVKFSTCYPTKP